MDLFDTHVLIGVVRNIKLAPTFLLDRFFGQIVESETEYVDIDVDVGARRMSPFVSPLVEGKLVEGRRITTNSFRPAYIKDKRAPDLKRPVRRALGERIAGDMTPAERMQANLEFELADQVDMLRRRLVWMAASALQTGSVTITGEGFPAAVVNFGRDPALTIGGLSGTGAAWTPANVAAGTATPCNNIDTWAALVLQKSGAVVTDLIFTMTAWYGFLADPLLKDAIWFPRSGDSSVDMGGGVKSGAMFKGVWGNYRLWLYNDWYLDPVTGVETPMVADKQVILVSEDLQGVQAFGAIIDPAHNYGAMAFAPKSWLQQDPAQRLMMLQSAPIVIPSRVNSAACATVA